MAAADSELTTKNILTEMAVVLLLILATIAPFAQSLDSGYTLSKLSLIKEIDFLQRGDIDGYIDISSDPSASICHAPNEMYAASTSYGLPLWNPESGCGRPVIGDFQTLLFSLFHRYFPVGVSQLNSLGILLKIVLASLGAFCFARMLGVSRLASFAAGMAFALCPRDLQFAELCNNYCFYPWMLACAVWTSAKISMHRSAIFALILAAFAYNMHPETWVIGTAAALTFAMLRGVNALASSISLRNRVLQSTTWTGAVALLTFLLSAPIVIPFCEFILNGVSYKFDAASSSNRIDFMDIFSYFSNLSVPMSSGSPCIGPVLSLLCLPGLLLTWRNHRALVFLFLASLFFSTRPGPLEYLFSLKPISFLLPEYTIYLAILLSGTFGALGLEGFIKTSSKHARALPRRILAVCGLMMMLCISALWIIKSPFFCEFWSDKTDWGYSNQALDGTASILGLAVMALVVALSFVRAEGLKRWWTAIGVLLVLANSVPLALYGKQVLPSTKAFWYKLDPLIAQLKSLQKDGLYRSTATGCWIFQPNSNLIFGTTDFRSTAPLHPKRYARFIDLAGIRSKYCNIYESPSRLNHLYDLASVKYVISNMPVHSRVLQDSKNELGDFMQSNCDLSCKPVPGIYLERAELRYYASSHQVTGKVFLKVHEHASMHNIQRIVLAAENGKRLWQSPLILEPLENFGRSLGKHRWEFSFEAPVPAAYHGTLSVLLQVGQYIGGKIQGPEVLLTRIKTPANDARLLNGRIGRIADASNYLQLYENKKVLPPVYLVHKIYPAANDEESFDLLRDRQIDWSNAAVIEGRNLPQPVACSPQTNKESIKILDKDADSVSIYAVNKAPCYALLTDTYYPGWQVFVDGKLADIQPSNYAFRSVFLPTPGKHQVLFVYNPASFSWGCRLMFAGLACSAMLLLLTLAQLTRRRPDAKQNTEEKQSSPTAAAGNSKDCLPV